MLHVRARDLLLTIQRSSMSLETSTHYAWRPEDYLREQTHPQDDFSRKHTTTIEWKSMQSPGKGKAQKNPARARRVARKEKKATQAKVTEKRQQNTHNSMENVETVESVGTGRLIVGTKQTNKFQGKGKGTGKSKSQGDRNQ